MEETKEIKEKKERSDKVESVEKKVVTVDISVEDVLKYNQDKKIVLIWDHTNFAELPEAVVNDLREENKRNYLQAKGVFDFIKKDSQREEDDIVKNIISPLEDQIGYHTHKLELRKRPGYHQCWKRPEEVEYAKSAGYSLVRDLDDKQRASGKEVEAGRENGEIKKIRKSAKTGVVMDELIAMEIPEEIYRKHQLAVSARSKLRYRNIKDTFRKEAETVNSRYGGGDRYVKVI